MKYLLSITAVAAVVAFVIYRKRKEQWIPLGGIPISGIYTKEGLFTIGGQPGAHEMVIPLNDEVGY